VLPVAFLRSAVMRGDVPGPAGPGFIFNGDLRADPGRSCAFRVRTVKARTAGPADPFIVVALGIVQDHHAGMKAGARGYEVS
jgi:hypothetical protein